jgi:hypothetical protein
VRLLGAAHVRNEADIVEAFVRHNLVLLDGIAIVDHASVDATPDILRALGWLANLRVPVRERNASLHWKEPSNIFAPVGR